MEKQERASCSPSLLVAQERLISLRAALEKSHHLPWKGPETVSGTPGSKTSRISAIPDHLGWGSARLSDSIRLCQLREAKTESPREFATTSHPPLSDRGVEKKQGVSASIIGNIKLFPDIALAFLRHKLASVARIWLLLKHLDARGSGWIAEKRARAHLSGKTGSLRICGLRQLRKLIAKGDGVFWMRSSGRIWLRSLSKIAVTLGVPRLVSPPIALPIEVLLESIGVVRAHFYASFHSGRIQSIKFGKPISRATLRKMSAVCSKTQVQYERRSGVRSCSNYAIGGTVSSDEIQEHAWRHGRALFIFTDKRGLLGAKGQNYTAWQLPNSYAGPHEQQPKGRRNRINRELTDLFTKGMTGNDRCLEKTVTPGIRFAGKRYFFSGSAAVTAFNRAPKDDLFWSAVGRRYPHQGNFITHNNHCLWHVLPGEE